MTRAPMEYKPHYRSPLKLLQCQRLERLEFSSLGLRSGLVCPRRLVRGGDGGEASTCPPIFGKKRKVLTYHYREGVTTERT